MVSRPSTYNEAVPIMYIIKDEADRGTQAKPYKVNAL